MLKRTLKQVLPFSGYGDADRSRPPRHASPAECCPDGPQGEHAYWVPGPGRWPVGARGPDLPFSEEGTETLPIRDFPRGHSGWGRCHTHSFLKMGKHPLTPPTPV